MATSDPAESGKPEDPASGSSSTPTASSTAAPTTPTRTRDTDRHLHQVDIVRLITFAAVILDHVLLGIAAGTAIAAGALGLLLRYTRYSFFALTGFVLTYQYRHRPLHPVTFWRRRYKLIGLPFLTWSLFYWVYLRYHFGGIDALHQVVSSTDEILLALKSIGYDLITGTAEYHLYFLSVSMQIYAIFPLLLIVLRKTWGFHRYLLTLSLAFHLGLLYLMVRPPLGFFTHGPQHAVWTHLLVTVFPYQFFILAGCVAAMHFEAFNRFLMRYRWPLSGLGAVAVVATIGYYLHATGNGLSVFRAANVFMPHNVAAYIGIIVILYCLGTVWRTRRTPGSTSDWLVRTAADRSFGIYLAHALALVVVMPTATAHRDLPMWPLILVAYLATVVLTVFLVEVLRRSPVSLITTGRPMIDPATQKPALSATVGLIAVVVGSLLRGELHLPAGSLVAATGVLLCLTALVVYAQQRAALRPPAATASSATR